MTKIDKMRQRIEEYKSERVAQGLPAELPEPIVPIALAAVLVERSTSVYEYLAKYTKLCNEADAILPANGVLFDKFTDYMKLVRNSEHPINTFGMGILIAMKTIQKAGEYENVSDYVRRLLLALNIARNGYKRTINEIAYDYKIGKIDDTIYEEYERLSTDEAYFDAEVARYLKQIGGGN
ncbi:hypothetical protein [Heyndrickxia sporothermodurans]|uniref:hypothetical protein n=1 Tax=Heyndrickxia sporothermodurans TaxID=46224 RepID=UPI0035DACE96